jgi:hypothetical protein
MTSLASLRARRIMVTARAVGRRPDQDGAVFLTRTMAGSAGYTLVPAMLEGAPLIKRCGIALRLASVYLPEQAPRYADHGHDQQNEQHHSRRCSFAPVT